ncbi:MAG: hypothetical protein K6B65_06965 [Bacilli bacterium]|nr:hypothetical protein [Bacilli bacterium]
MEKNELSFGYVGTFQKTYYSDSYFFLDNAAYHEELALASVSLAGTFFYNYEKQEEKTWQSKDYWDKTGFSRQYFNEYCTKKAEIHSIGFGIASKTITSIDGTTYTLFSIPIRGADYGAENAGNVEIGDEGNAYGFQVAAEQVYEGLSSYIKSNGISGKAKFWTSGFSRGGAVANLFGGLLVERPLETLSYGEDDLYDYCFNSPSSAYLPEFQATSKTYKGIHSVLNLNDPFTYLIPRDIGFTRYGSVHYIPDRLTDVLYDERDRERMVKRYHYMDRGYEDAGLYNVDLWRFYDVGEKAAIKNNLPRDAIHPSMARFFQGFVDGFCKTDVDLTINRHTYSQFIEDGVRDFVASLFGANPKLAPFDLDELTDLIFNTPLFAMISNEVQQGHITDFIMDCGFLVSALYDKEGTDPEALEEIIASLEPLFGVLANLFKDRPDLSAQVFDRDNLLNTFHAHNMELTYNALLCCDSRFEEEPTKLNDGCYYALHLSPSTKISVYENGLGKEMFHYELGDMSESVLAGEKYADNSVDVFLPKDGRYAYTTDSSSISLYEVYPNRGKELIKEDMPQKGNIN